MLKQQFKRKTSQQGFTLLEILVVVAIMGFLVAMVAPRFAGVTQGTMSTVCNSSKLRGQQMVTAFYEQNGRYPNGLLNLVMTDGASLDAARYQVPYIENQDPADGKEVLGNSHNNNFKFMIHHLNAAEATELRGLGVTRVYNLNDYGDLLANLGELTAGDAVGKTATGDGLNRTNNWQPVDIVAATAQRPYMEAVTIDEGVGVIMSTVGADGSGNDATFEYVGVRKPASGRNDYFGRIIFGLGPESELVTSGMAANAGMSPNASTTENFSWGGYYLVMPRLSATVARLKATDPAPTFTNIATGGPAQNFYDGFLASGKVLALGMERGTDYQPGWIVAAENNNNRNFTRRTVNLLEAMPAYEFAVNPVHTDLRWALALGEIPNE